MEVGEVIVKTKMTVGMLSKSPVIRRTLQFHLSYSNHICSFWFKSFELKGEHGPLRCLQSHIPYSVQMCSWGITKEETALWIPAAKQSLGFQGTGQGIDWPSIHMGNLGIGLTYVGEEQHIWGMARAYRAWIWEREWVIHETGQIRRQSHLLLIPSHLSLRKRPSWSSVTQCVTQDHCHLIFKVFVESVPYQAETTVDVTSLSVNNAQYGCITPDIQAIWRIN